MNKDNFAYPYNDWRDPDWRVPPHYPYPDGVHPKHGGPWNDTEPAANIEPWCPPHPFDDCICVTSADVDRWNVITAYGPIDKIDWKTISMLSGYDIPLSATYWNSCYETVYENSGYWDKAKNFDQLQNDIDGLEEEIISMSANIDSRIGLTQVYTEQTPYVVDGKSYPYYIQGVGTKENPLYLSEHVKQLLYYLETGNVYDTVEQIHAGLPSVPATPPFATVTELEKIKTTEKYYDNLITEIQSDYNVLGKTVKTIIDMLNQSGSSSNWKNEDISADISKSKENPEVFYYWSSES